MRAKESSVRIAVNTMRARLTALGFNITIITFQITQLSSERSGPVVPGFDGTLQTATIALHFALLLSVAAMVALLASSAMSGDGACDSPAFVAGDLLMFLGLSYTLVAFFQPLLTELSTRQLPTPQDTEKFQLLFRTISYMAAVTWALAAYVGPIVSLLRSPFGKVWNVALGVSYLLLMVMLAHFIGIAFELQLRLEHEYVSQWPVLQLFFLPLEWLIPVTTR
ncbi:MULTISPECIES: hypothetical protein [Halocynthiibacter]|uniref:Uncharacterized protein n=1 Tax=Halocynthiibacter halioticoli TaxID=2986804 RepID=A0AAE3LRW4_9RHOB|nr:MULTISPECIES: hypothetical protein [Halocynthiibacter]MCV6825058.1 hypothetical protein [Halocynthiibacter halioticoli]MCW4058059.1 hypothetical protein [Halocynthiibacter sp. SDUM655004]